MEHYPTDLRREGDDALLIHWSNGSVRRYSLAELRRNCPCATCREKRSAKPTNPNSLPVVSPAEAQPLGIAAMKPVGSYAYSIVFSDGHDTGIYTFELLQQLGSSVD